MTKEEIVKMERVEALLILASRRARDLDLNGAFSYIAEATNILVPLYTEELKEKEK